jgi:hypothetical protein
MPVRSFSQLALVFALLFALLVLGSLFPFQPLDAAWQIRLAAVLVNAATLPLLALALLQLARLLEPRDPSIRARQERFAQLAIAASLGFLLLAPLQISAGLRLQSRGGAEQRSQLQRAERQLAGLHLAVAQAASKADLKSRFQALNGPGVSPADLELALPQLKAQATMALDQAQVQFARQRVALPATDPLRLLPEQLRNTGACLALACGFAIFARRRGSELSLLEEGQRSLLRMRMQRPSRSATVSNEEYIRQLSGDEEER